MRTPMTKEREADISLLTAMEPHSVFDTDLLQAIADLESEVKRLRANENLAVAAALELAAQHYRFLFGTRYRCNCGEETETIEQWQQHIRALAPDAQKLLAAHEEEVAESGFDKGADSAMEAVSNTLAKVMAREDGDKRSPHDRLWDEIEHDRQTARQQEQERCVAILRFHGHEGMANAIQETLP